MLVKENIETINILLNKIFDFVKTDEDIQQDLQQYTNNIKAKLTSESDLQAVLMTYLFENKLPKTGKKVFDLYIDKHKDISKEEKSILTSFNSSISSIFEIKRLIKNSFELYNLVNEKIYRTIPLIKMTNFRGIVPGQYLNCRLISHENDYYLIGIDQLIPSSSRESIYRYVVMKQLESPELIYDDNEEKLAEIEESVKDLETKFQDYFNKDEIITSSQYVDDLLSKFNDFIENNNQDTSDDKDKYIVNPEKFAYFEVKEVTNGVMDPIQAAVKGFSSHEKIYDVGILFDSDSGLLVLPFYGTFKKIFAVSDYKSIEGYKECILQYLNSERIPAAPILKVYNENKANFDKIITEVLELEKQPDIQELLHKYKDQYYAKKTFSALTILYLSKSFNELMTIASENKSSSKSEPDNQKIGRNDPCLCGSGKKYKKCCLK